MIPDDTEKLVIGSVTLTTRGWWIQDHTPLMEEAPQRGGDKLLPTAAGVKPYQRRRTVRRVLLPMTVNGIFNGQTGAAFADAKDGLRLNIDYLNTNLVAPVGSGDGTRAATWHLPDGTTTRTANVHVLSLTFGSRETPKWVDAVLELSIPTGVFT